MTSTAHEAKARERLADLFDLGSVKRQIVRVRVHGRGGKAHVRIDLDNGDRIEFDPFSSVWQPAKMKYEISAQAGSEPKPNGDGVQEIVKLIFWLGEHYADVQTTDQAWELGAEYLRKGVPGDVDMSDQASRWKAFQSLVTREGRLSDMILHDTATGKRYVRSDWLTGYLRARGDPGEAAELKKALGRQGWRKPGTEGRIKATDPAGLKPPLIWAFLIVPKGWENGESGDPE